MRSRVLACAVAGALLAVPAAATAAAPSSSSVAWIRSAATRVIQAELARDGGAACGVLYAPLAATRNGRTCAQRWDARIAAVLARPGAAARLEADLRAVPTAAVTVDGIHATIALPHPLFHGASRFVWNDMCWMLTG